mgnify:CR=1 FL=1|jgi:hypothetical protein
MKYIFLIYASFISFFAFSNELEADINLLACDLNSDDLSSVTCFKKGERISGLNKICTYNCLGSDKAITIKSTQLCPLSIKG